MSLYQSSPGGAVTHTHDFQIVSLLCELMFSYWKTLIIGFGFFLFGWFYLLLFLVFFFFAMKSWKLECMFEAGLLCMSKHQ